MGTALEETAMLVPEEILRGQRFHLAPVRVAILSPLHGEEEGQVQTAACKATTPTVPALLLPWVPNSPQCAWKGSERFCSFLMMFIL